MILAPTFAAPIPKHRRSRFALACAAARRSTIIIINKNSNEKKKIARAGKRTCTQTPSDSKSIALTTRPPRLVFLSSKASYVYLAENALNAFLSSAEWVSEWVSDSRALVIRLHWTGDHGGCKGDKKHCCFHWEINYEPNWDVKRLWNY